LLKIDPAPAANPVQEDWLISPMFIVPANASVHFVSRLLQNGDQGSIYKVMIGSNLDNLSTFNSIYTATEFEMNSAQTNYVEKDIAIPAQYMFQQVYVAFVMVGSNADGWMVDNVQIASNCPEPTNLTAGDLTGTSAALSWTQIGGATSWEVEVLEQTAAPTGTGIVFSGTPPYIVTNLLPDTSYKYYVRAMCPDGGMSVWVGPYYFPDNNCPTPTGLSQTTVTPQAVTYTWNATDAAQGYDYWYTETNDIPNETTIPSGSIAAPTVTIAVPNSTGNHKFYVRSHCGLNWYSPWTGYPQQSSSNNIIHGKVLFDSNESGSCDAGDVGIPFTEVQIEINDFTYSVYTNQNGQFNLYGWPDGSYTVNLQAVSPLFTSIDPLVQQVIFDEEVNNVDINYCLGNPIAVNDLEVTIVPLGPARPGLNTYYRVAVKNSGTQQLDDVTVSLSFDNSRISFVSSALPGTIATAGSLSIPVGDVQPFTSVNGNVLFHVMQPPVNMGGEILHFEAELSDVANDANPANNEAVINHIIVNSYDPNDLTVHEGAEIYVEQADDYLTYTIRFQNTGTAEAIDIKLENTLDDLLDWETFKPITSSHSYEVKRTGNLLEFDYKNILLPDSTTNEPGSHGFVTYKVKPKAEYGLGDIVSNQAEIYFDFNPAITTNIATTEVIELTAGLNNNAIAIARLYPNPVKDQLHVEVGQGELKSVAVYDINGRLCLSANANVIDTNVLNSGIYFVKVTTDAGSANYKIIKH
jgi:hypothetical protein